ncbi:NAD-dependent deacylase [Robertkochia marina]|uniref:NAD-dependent protein deacylase n=1 Tax=Robertkochia marina TaxID=1227945 RepID=A0A4S3LZD2_9FLAO|nr:Sir2 family NAD-dependent protein deacetylase [Robertkochia marina]THD67480.1 NAD-dependent deacylase [Robertkochia marina]TRZ44652.1 NAD-dependent deacylase [Robertkochia marina]
MKKLVVLTGAGISAESGLKTFRDAGGLWEGHDVMEVASPRGWQNDPELVLDFYNQRRRQLLETTPNTAHKAIAAAQEHFDVTIITQNIDDLHERAGSKQVIHLHGELLKVRSSEYDHLIYPWEKDLFMGDLCEKQRQLRPHIVWFGEAVPMMEPAIEEVMLADHLLIVGTSMTVYPAASLMQYAPQGCPVFFVDPRPNLGPGLRSGLHIISENATTGVPIALEHLARI